MLIGFGPTLCVGESISLATDMELINVEDLNSGDAISLDVPSAIRRYNLRRGDFVKLMLWDDRVSVPERLWFQVLGRTRGRNRGTLSTRPVVLDMALVTQWCSERSTFWKAWRGEGMAKPLVSRVALAFRLADTDSRREPPDTDSRRSLLSVLAGLGNGPGPRRSTNRPLVRPNITSERAMPLSQNAFPQKTPERKQRCNYSAVISARHTSSR
jgi:hypothetical protein